MRVILPHEGTGIAETRAAIVVGNPVIFELPTRRNLCACTGGNVMCPLIVLRIVKSVRVHTIAAARFEGVVAEMDHNSVAHFRTDNGPQHPQPLWLGLGGTKRGIGVLDVANFREDVALCPRFGNWSAMD